LPRSTVLIDIHPRSGNFAPVQIFLIVSTCFLYLVAAGLFSKSVWFFEQNHVRDHCLLQYTQFDHWQQVVEPPYWWWCCRDWVGTRLLQHSTERVAC